MRKTYDFTDAKPNPYAKRLKKQVTIRLDPGVLAYFQELAEELGIPYQTLINLFPQGVRHDEEATVDDLATTSEVGIETSSLERAFSP
ncbi:MAG TPA: BrnA antitoxin family protein [Thermoanaerobaculia bacterium]|jgi:hypothetical protein|nr:BrnA antitoxin family protein [Thermoanaerobaculia bacterium]